MRRMLWDRLSSEVPDVSLNGPADFTRRHPGNLNVSFSYVEGEAILLLLDSFGISVTTGSACSSGSLGTSHVLNAIDVPVTRANGAIRFTTGDFTTEEDIEYVVETVKKVIGRLRELSPVTGEEGW